MEGGDELGASKPTARCSSRALFRLKTIVLF